MEFSDDATKEIYLYNQEDTDINIAINSSTGNITKAVVRGGGNRALDETTKDSAVQIDGFGWSYTQTLSETAGPVNMKITGKTNERFLGLANTNRREDQHSVLGERYLKIYNTAGEKVESTDNGLTQDGYFKLVVKSQTYKYQPKELTNADKVTVANPNTLSQTDLDSIKNNLKLIYSTTSTDARLASVRGSEVTNSSSFIKSVTQSTEAGKLVVTYNDDSTDLIEKSTVIKRGTAPTVNTTITAQGSIPNSVPSSDSELTGTGTPGATVKVTVKNPETGAVISEKTAVVGEDGTWKLPLEEGLNSNTQLPGASEAARRFFAPKNPVEITQVVNGIETPSTAVSVAVGASKILPSAAAKDGASVVAGAKEVTVTVPHDAGRSYFFYTAKGATSTTEIALEQSQNGW